MDFLENKDQELVFYNHDPNRAVAVVSPAIVENRLTDALRGYMRRDEKVADELFRPEGALGAFGRKIKLGYMLGLYGQDLKDDLVLLTKIRNAFARRVPVSDFQHSVTAQVVHVSEKACVIDFGLRAIGALQLVPLQCAEGDYLAGDIWHWPALNEALFMVASIAAKTEFSDEELSLDPDL
jgi:hypothetical protein